MGRKGQGHKLKQAIKLKYEAEEQELTETVDNLLKICTLPQQSNVQKALEYQKKSLTITEFKGYELGLQVNTHIPQSSLVMAVPRRIMLTIEAARNSELKKLIEKDQILKNMSNVTLAIFLLVQKFKQDSFWKPYIDILPSSYSTVLYFSVEDLEHLKGSPTLEIALRQIKSIARQYAYFHQLFHSLGGFYWQTNEPEIYLQGILVKKVGTPQKSTSSLLKILNLVLREGTSTKDTGHTTIPEQVPTVQSGSRTRPMKPVK
ncbi:hypothetical protein NQ317_000892 [Molorchus minor]|uniref:protein-histidine N-methyltransferase n=1 Tax=Molorchus minor TaxID=1323400 RepID=A0ABQ9JBR7_9CUCU|nr:hypothetical protein NQ317_000892 [Molorchus minor]